VKVNEGVSCDLTVSALGSEFKLILFYAAV
jgi:hypothetical protein